jgi:hypothetical protein
MKLFTNINNDNINKYIYSELLAIAYLNPSFFDFLKYEKNRYIMNDLVLHNLIVLEASRLNIKTNKINEFALEHNWDVLKKVVDISIKLKEKMKMENPMISISESAVYIINDSTPFIFKPFYQNNNDITISYPDNYSVLLKEWICMRTDLISQTILPEYSGKFESFFTVMKEKGIELDEISYNSDIYDTLGVRFDNLPALYYKSLKPLINDILKDETMFKDISYVKSSLRNINKTFVSQLKESKIHIVNFMSNYYTYNEKTDSIVLIPEIRDYKVCSNPNYDKLIFKFGNIEIAKDIYNNDLIFTIK